MRLTIEKMNMAVVVKNIPASTVGVATDDASMQEMRL